MKKYFTIYKFKIGRRIFNKTEPQRRFTLTGYKYIGFPLLQAKIF